jgi:lantibiotic leader peptide-processing serine protease
MPHRLAAERPSGADKSVGARAGSRRERVTKSTEPLSSLQWDMAMLKVDQAHQRATGRGVDVGIIDTGIDARHPDLARNFDRARSDGEGVINAARPWQSHGVACPDAALL